MSWPHLSHPSQWHDDPFMGPEDMEADIQAYINFVQSAPSTTTSNAPEHLPAAQHQQAQQQTQSYTMQPLNDDFPPAQYQQFSSFDTPPQPLPPIPSIYGDTLPYPPPLPSLPRSRLPRPMPKFDWVEFVDTLEWLVNAEIPPEDRTCPFCWGEFGLEEVFEDEDEDSPSFSSEDGEGGDKDEEYEYEFVEEIYSILEDNDGSGGTDEQEVGVEADTTTILPSWTSYSDTEAENNDIKDGYEPDEEEDPPAKLTESALSELQKRLVHEVRQETGLKEEKKVEKKHYAVQLPCGHLLGHMCLVRMLESGERVCPKCRKDIVERRPEGR